MPPKAKFTKNEIVEAAMQIVREQGLEAVTSRELGKKLGSSACPIFTVFSNMEEVKSEIIIEAKEIYKGYVMEGLKQDVAFRGVGFAYIQFSIKEPKLFHLLFMREQSEPTDIGHTLMLIDANYEEILNSVKEPYGLQEEDAKRLYQHLWVYTHGIASMCATKVVVFAMIPALLIGTDKYDISQYFEFKLPYFQDNLYMMMVMGAIYGVFRLIGAIGLLKNRMWGLVLSVINCVITIALMMFLLPAGIMDGILAGSALILILMQYYGDKKVVE